MKKTLLISILLIALLLLSFNSYTKNVTNETLAGVWQQENYQEKADVDESAYELYFTDDGFMYLLRSSYGTDIGYHTDTFEYYYNTENNVLHWIEPDPDRNIPYEKMNIKMKDNRIELTIKYRLGMDKVTLIKVSDTVPFGYTQVDKDTIAAEEKAIRDSIIAFSAELSEKTNLLVTLNEDAHFSYWAYQGVKFSSGETLFQITLSVNAEKTDGSDEYYIPNAEGGATYRNVRCYVLGDCAIMFEGEEPPLEWRRALENLQAEKAGRF